MRRRLDIAASIVTTPRLLFLDEPTTGLDPRSRNQVWDIVRALVGAGTTVLLTTQYLEEADQLADRIAIIDHGRVIAEGTSSELKASVGSGRPAGAPARPRAPARTPRRSCRTLGRTVRLETDPAALSAAAGTGRRHRALAALADAGIEVGEFAYGQPSLDEVFLALTGHPADDQIDNATEEAMREHAHRNHAGDGHQRGRRPIGGRRRSARPTPSAPGRRRSRSRGGRCSRSSTSPMQLFDVTVFPVMFVLLFTYLFGGALAGSTSEYLQELLPGILVHDRRDDHDLHRHGPEHGSPEGHLRPLPVDARVAPGGARRDAHGRRRPLHGCVDRRARRSASSSGSGPTAASSASRWPIGLLLVFCFACRGCGS